MEHLHRWELQTPIQNEDPQLEVTYCRSRRRCMQWWKWAQETQTYGGVCFWSGMKDNFCAMETLVALLWHLNCIFLFWFLVIFGLWVVFNRRYFFLSLPESKTTKNPVHKECNTCQRLHGQHDLGYYKLYLFYSFHLYCHVCKSEPHGDL